MTPKEFKKLKSGDKVMWPEGANGCAATVGTIQQNQYGYLYIVWDDGQETHSSDGPAIAFVQKLGGAE
jgi:hypothetical protein